MLGSGPGFGLNYNTGQKRNVTDITSTPYNYTPGINNRADLLLAQALEANAQGGPPVLAPIGEYLISATMSITGGPIEFSGQGRAAGPGAVLNTNCTQLLAGTATGDLLDVGPTLYGSEIRSMQFNSNVGQRTSGNAILLNGSGLGSVQANYILDDLAFNNQYCDIYLNDVGTGLITDTFHFQWAYVALYQIGDGTNENGPGFISNNYFFGNTNAGTNQYSALYFQCGYFKFRDNYVIGSKIGIWLDIDQYPAGAPEIRFNLFEEQDVSSVYMLNSGTQISSMVDISYNEFSVATLGSSGRPNFQSHITIVAGSANWIDTLHINQNRFRTTCNLNSAIFINVQSGEYVSICGNTLEGLSGNATTGIAVGAQVTSCQVLDNVIRGSFNIPYILTANCILRDLNSGLTAAQVNAITCANGSMVWVSDGNPNLATLTGSSTGCFAFRQGGVWVVGDSQGQPTPTLTFATLPAVATSKGSRFMISDGSVAASGNFGAAAAGSGSNVVPVYSDGTTWRIG